jgi:hypothetical protein
MTEGRRANDGGFFRLFPCFFVAGENLCFCGSAGDQCLPMRTSPFADGMLALQFTPNVGCALLTPDSMQTPCRLQFEQHSNTAETAETKIPLPVIPLTGGNPETPNSHKPRPAPTRHSRESGNPGTCLPARSAANQNLPQEGGVAPKAGRKELGSLESENVDQESGRKNNLVISSAGIGCVHRKTDSGLKPRPLGRCEGWNPGLEGRGFDRSYLGWVQTPSKFVHSDRHECLSLISCSNIGG